jgi:hypothetical protein
MDTYKSYDHATMSVLGGVNAAWAATVSRR